MRPCSSAVERVTLKMVIPSQGTHQEACRPSKAEVAGSIPARVAKLGHYPQKPKIDRLFPVTCILYRAQ